jgi:phenylacetate-CoA ligase
MHLLDRRNETMSAAELEQVQLERLQALVARLRRNIRRYREKLADAEVKSLADLERLPFTAPEDLVESFPYGMFAFPLREIIRLYSTLGPEGKPLVIGHTRNDLAQWGRLVARQLAAAGVTANDVIQISLGRVGDACAAGYVLGAEQLEASVIAEDPIHMDYHLDVLKNYRPTFLITTPAHALDLTRTIEKRQMDPQSLQLRGVILSRPVSSQLREQLAAGLFSVVRCNFGAAELLDPGLALECPEGRMHIQEDQFLPEVQDGELVVTTLCREALPLLRYRTRLSAGLSREKCACGRTGAILQTGARLDKRYRVNETEFYEGQVGQVLGQTRAAGHTFRLEATERRLVILIAMSEQLFASTLSSPAETKREIESEILVRLGVESEVQFVQPERRLSEA